MEIAIDGRKIGPACEPYVIAELSANHNGDLEKALRTIDSAKACGADAIKIQTYTPQTMTIRCDSEDFVISGGLWDGYRLYDLYDQAHTPYEWHGDLFDHARKIGITIFSSPFDETAVDLLEELNAPAYKIASFEIVDIPLIEYVARRGKPMIISTGMANEPEIRQAVEAARDNGCNELALLHCVSSYPAPVEQSNLRTIRDIQERFGVVAGLSDHTLGTTVAVAAIASGASLLEKHFILSREDTGPDSEFSLEPEELRRLCAESKTAWLALGKAGYDRQSSEAGSIKFRRSIYVVEDINAGQEFSARNVRRIRPGYGMWPGHYNAIIGRKATRDIKRGTALSPDMIENFQDT